MQCMYHRSASCVALQRSNHVGCSRAANAGPRWCALPSAAGAHDLACVRPKERRCSLKVQAWGGRPQTVDTAAAAAAAAAAHTAKLLRVPLWQHALKASVIIGVAVAGAVVMARLLHEEADKAEAGEELTWMQSMDDAEKQAQKRWVTHVWESGLLALHRPAAVCLPVMAAVVSLRTGAEFLEALLAHHNQHAVISTWSATATKQLLTMLNAADVVVQEAAQIAMIGFIVWALLRFKERLVKVLMDVNIAKDVKGGVSSQNVENSMERVVLPFSGLASWVLILGGVMATLSVMGINIQPLLTVGGVSGIIVGLSAQSVLGNMISGINLFISRPFVVGERIEVMAPGSGSKWLVGVVERVDPMRTIIRSDACLPITIPNKVLSEQVIHNESRIAKTRVVVNFNKPRVMQFTWGVRYQDFDQVQSITKCMRAYLDTIDGIDRRLPLWVGFTGVENHCCNIFTILHTTPAKSREYGGFREGIFYAFEKVVKQHGAALAYPTHVNVVPQLTPEDVGAYKAWSGNGAERKGNPAMYTSPGLAN